jgi:predicted HicB family RNase H-like nuclease
MTGINDVENGEARQNDHDRYRAIPEEDDNGRLNVRVLKRLHRDLVRAAEAEGVSLNLFVATALARAVSHIPNR